MPSERDPRIHPRRGDILEKGNRCREVTSGAVFFSPVEYLAFLFTGTSRPIKRKCSPEAWCRWAFDARIIKSVEWRDE